MPILVVEDHSATALILRTLLTRLGFSDVDQAIDGLVALAVAPAKTPVKGSARLRQEAGRPV
ncbi:hypothetical protein [Bradyrhizobium sp. AUGA SZCCT0431]|uniref:hypothetical protein n=1 Tax=Bradyrhizobium sp. AUGA SZCCT0431 TaxID=2807674 RepID=UPI001BAC4F45|nr:hypothetical protein [Bradyrhizobium sp. AUGA SZCCT0431]MBR1147721.1 hypothetical protein [Bradyrhizobium sp. AUGA SZCCT0431]